MWGGDCKDLFDISIYARKGAHHVHVRMGGDLQDVTVEEAGQKAGKGCRVAAGTKAGADAGAGEQALEFGMLPPGGAMALAAGGRVAGRGARPLHTDGPRLRRAAARRVARGTCGGSIAGHGVVVVVVVLGSSGSSAVALGLIRHGAFVERKGTEPWSEYKWVRYEQKKNLYWYSTGEGDVGRRGEM